MVARVAVLCALAGCGSGGTVQLPGPPADSADPTAGPQSTLVPLPEVTVHDEAHLAGVSGIEADGTFNHGRSCVVADLDNDGWSDLVVGNPGDPSYWYRNTSSPGSLSFELMDVLADGYYFWGTGAADFDFDGDLDLAVAGGGIESIDWNMLLINNLDGPVPTFADRGRELGISGVPTTELQVGALRGGTVSAVWLDFDGDGDLDLWFDESSDPPSLLLEPQTIPYGRNSLWLQDDQGSFVDGTVAAGLGDHVAATQWSSWFDFDNDNDPDLFETNYKWGRIDGFNHFWVNEDGVMVDRTTTAMLDGSDLSYPREVFSSAASDLNQDGFLDLVLFVRKLPTEGAFKLGHVVLLNVGGTGFVDATALSMINNPFDPGYRDHVSLGVMGSSAEDFDLNGIPDLLIGQGGPSSGWTNHLFLARGLFEHDFPGVGPMMVPLYDNRTDLIDFPAQPANDSVTMPAYPYRTHGMCFTDFDRDGRRDVFVANGGTIASFGEASAEPDRLFVVDQEVPARFLRIELHGDNVAVDPHAIFARIAVDVADTQGTRTVYDTVTSHNGFGAHHGYERLIGLGQAERIERVQITWPNGTVRVLDNVALDETLDLTY